MKRRGESQMVQITGCDDFGWSWKRVDEDGVTVAEGKSSLAEDAAIAASEVAKRPFLQSRDGKMGR